MVIIAIGAHPDDIEFGCYGTLCKYKNAEKIIFILFSAGEIVCDKKIRLEEANNSAEIIGAKIIFLNYPDGNIPINSKSIKKLKEIIDRYQPKIVFTLHPQDTHQDHRAVSQITLSACRYVPKIVFYEVPQTVTSFSPNYFVDITDYFEYKEKALNCFRSQNKKPYLNIAQIQGLAAYRAYNVYKKDKLYEAFYTYREIDE
jgi:LmbE family N-acetylglucosaminyl deacetylase